MKNCFSCDNMLTDDAAYCYVCSTHQNSGFEAFEAKPKVNDTFLKVLCILTIVGTTLSLVLVPFSWGAVEAYGVESLKIAAFIGIFVEIGKLTGAILMLKHKLMGLYTYSAASVVGMVATLWSTFTVSSTLGGTFAAIMSFSSLLFPVAFLVMYWLPVNKKVLS